MARPVKTRVIVQQPTKRLYIPTNEIEDDVELMQLPVECMEAIRLIDVEGMNQAAAARLMNVSRQTFGRILNTGRSIVGNALTYGKGILVDGGNYQFPENNNKSHHRKRCFQNNKKEMSHMPNQDGTGPRGQGKGCGQGKGRCNSSGGRGRKGNGGNRGGGGGKGCGQNQGSGNR